MSRYAGRHAFPRHAYHFETEIVDPDFDEEWGWGDCALLAHEIETTGTVALHPDGDRRSSDFDPVPLHTRVYNDGTVAELKKREWKQHLEDRKLWAEERRRERSGAGARLSQRRRRTSSTELRLTPRSPEPPCRSGLPPKPLTSIPSSSCLPHAARRVRSRAGQGRVGGPVMINEADLDDWTQGRTPGVGCPRSGAGAASSSSS